MRILVTRAETAMRSGLDMALSDEGVIIVPVAGTAEARELMETDNWGALVVEGCTVDGSAHKSLMENIGALAKRAPVILASPGDAAGQAGACQPPTGAELVTLLRALASTPAREPAAC